MKVWILGGLLAGLPLLSGCSNDCRSAFDCAFDEVCYQSVCTPASAPYLSCTGDEDCNGGPEGLFSCRGGRCILDSVTPPASVDGGGSPVADSGMSTPPPDGGGGPERDSGANPSMDAGTNPMTDGGGTGDAGEGGPSDAATPDGAVADAGPGGPSAFSAVIDGTYVDFAVMSTAIFDATITNSMTIFGLSAAGESISVSFSSASPGRYLCSEALATVTLARGASNFSASSLLGLCDIDVSTVGAIGQSVVGTFTATLDDGFGGGTLSLTDGQFDVTRQ